MLQGLRRWYQRRLYRPGRVVSRFLAPDIRRDVQVVDTTLVDAGVITARVRTWNVLYAVNGIVTEPAFGPARTVPIGDLWAWSGAAWGGPVPDPADGTGRPAV